VARNSRTENYRHLVKACLDPKCRVSWISAVIVGALGMDDDVDRNFLSPRLADYHGREVTPLGTIAFRWSKNSSGRKVYEAVTLYVSPVGDIDVIFGSEYIVAQDLLRSNRERMLPFVEHAKEKLCKYIPTRLQRCNIDCFV